jgi:hypothetical protein
MMCFLRGINWVLIYDLEEIQPVRDKPIFSSERMLRKDYDRKGSVKKISVVSLKGLVGKVTLTQSVKG